VKLSDFSLTSSFGWGPNQSTTPKDRASRRTRGGHDPPHGLIFLLNTFGLRQTWCVFDLYDFPHLKFLSKSNSSRPTIQVGAESQKNSLNRPPYLGTNSRGTQIPPPAPSPAGGERRPLSGQILRPTAMCAASQDPNRGVHERCVPSSADGGTPPRQFRVRPKVEPSAPFALPPRAGPELPPHRLLERPEVELPRTASSRSRSSLRAASVRARESRCRLHTRNRSSLRVASSRGLSVF
jgi:hypothetical protein